MKYIFFVLLMPFLANTDCKNKQSQKAATHNSDTTALSAAQVLTQGLPKCIDSIISKAANEQPPIKAEKVELYEWQGKQVYLVSWQCCDFFNEVFDANCKRICAPTGGITGKGDGNCADFLKSAKLIKQLLPSMAK
jgi:hypothetical protein